MSGWFFVNTLGAGLNTFAALEPGGPIPDSVSAALAVILVLLAIAELEAA